MGQQQLLVIILVTIVIGIATIVAVNTFETAAESANRDALINDILSLASEGQQFYTNPVVLGGGGRTFEGFSIRGKIMPAMGISAAGDVAQTDNGTIEVRDADGQEFTIVAHLSECTGYLPGSVDDTGVLTNYGTCSETDQILVRVQPGDVLF